MSTCVIFGDRSPARQRLDAHLARAFDDRWCAGTVAELLEAMNERAPDVVVVTVDGGSGWLEAVRQVRRCEAAPPVVVVGEPGGTTSGEAPDRAAVLAMSHGARAFLCAGLLPEPHTPPGGRQVAAELSAREMDVLLGMTEGRSNSEIAAELFLAEDTVKTHARRLFRKLGAGDRADAVARGFRQGLLH